MEEDVMRPAAAVIMGWVLLVGLTYVNGQELHPKRFLTVVDAQDQKVGGVITVESSGWAVVAFEMEGRLFTVRVFRDRFFGPNARLLYESTNCSGQAFLEVDSPLPVLPPVAVIAPATVFLPLPDASVQAVNARSYQVDTDGSCLGFSETHNGLAAGSLIDLFTLFTPPFRVH
jgi:hypothetical protein